jgi:hypothetical protein
VVLGVSRQDDFVVVVPVSGDPFLGDPHELLAVRAESIGFKASRLAVIVDGRPEGPMLVGTVLRARALSTGDQLAIMSLVGSRYGSAPARVAPRAISP